MVSTAKANGTGHLLWPEGKDAVTIHNEMFVAIEHAHRVLSWQENLPSDEVPANWKWHLDWEIEAHFEKVKIERDRKYNKGGSSSDGGSFDDDDLSQDNLFYNRAKDELKN